MDDAHLIRLNHMLDAAREALSFAEGRKRHDLDGDRMLVLALTKEVEIIGEAATNISKAFQDQTPHIPWAAIIGMRNRLIHAYFEVDRDRVWETVIVALPPLIQQLETLLDPPDDEN